MELWEKYEEELQERYAERKESELEKASEYIDEQLISWGEEYGERIIREELNNSLTICFGVAYSYPDSI